MARRMKGPNLKPGLVEKYTSASSSRKERFQLLKEFLVDENMSSPQRTFQNGFNGFHWPLNHELLIHDCFIEERGVRWGLLCSVRTLRNSFGLIKSKVFYQVWMPLESEYFLVEGYIYIYAFYHVFAGIICQFPINTSLTAIHSSGKLKRNPLMYMRRWRGLSWRSNTAKPKVAGLGWLVLLGVSPIYTGVCFSRAYLERLKNSQVPSNVCHPCILCISETAWHDLLLFISWLTPSWWSEPSRFSTWNDFSSFDSKFFQTEQLLILISLATEFPDDERFKLFKVYRKNKTTSLLAEELPFFYSSQLLIVKPKIQSAISMGQLLTGGDVTRAGSKTSATAVCTGTAKAALGEMLDSQVAELKQSAGNTKQPKNPKTNRSPKEEAAKALQKDIKALLTCIHVRFSEFLSSWTCFRSLYDLISFHVFQRCWSKASW